MDISPKTYEPDKTQSTQSTKSFSISWTDVPNMELTNPPNPMFQTSNKVSYIEPMTLLPSTDKQGSYPVGVIQSKREPYAVEYMFNNYGGLQSKLGTNLGL